MRVFYSILIIFLLSGCIKYEEKTNPEIDNSNLTEFLNIGEETWMDVLISGNKVGYAVSSVRKTPNEGLLRFSNYSFFKMQRYKEEIITENTISEYSDYNLNPIKLTYIKSDSESGERTVTANISATNLEIIIRSKLGEERETCKLPDDFTIEGAARCRMLAQGIHPGMKQAFSIFDPEELDFIAVTVEVLEKINTVYNGTEIEVYKIKSVYHYSSELTVTELITEQGETIFLEIDSLGISFKKTSKENAVSSFTGYNLSDTVIPVNDFIPMGVKKLVLNIISEEPDLINLFPDDQFQKTDNENLNITISSFHDDKPVTIHLPYSFDSDTALFLKPTKIIQSDDEEIIRLAHEITKGETDIKAAAEYIYSWILNNIEGSYKITFASAKEVLEFGKGDCTEYAVLFAALARAYGIPAKVCIGLVYNYMDGFAFHAWNEIFTGTWQPVDVAMNQFYPDATHIKIYSGIMESLFEQSVTIQKLIGRIKFEVISYE